MNRNLLLVTAILCFTLKTFAQADIKTIDCGVNAAAQQWEDWMQASIEKYKAEGMAKKVVKTVIPVVVHVIHTGQGYGVYPNIDSNQIKSQIAILNADFAGTGLNSNAIPPAFQNLVTNTGIEFCRARKDQQDVQMAEFGVQRYDAGANGWTDPNTSGLDLINYMKTIIIPATRWDPTKYLNIWVTDKATNYPHRGWATYPPATGLSGMFAGDFGSLTVDGIWVYARNFGNVGANAPYDKGRTATHEVGHWLGLRHIWGDGNCLSDYVNDTPTQKKANYDCPSASTPDKCGVNTSPDGDMFMNFMDMTDDNCKSLFTTQQGIRMNTALSQSPLRFLLGTHDKCSGAPTPTSAAVASFSIVSNLCSTEPFVPYNTSSGYPQPTFLWSSSPSANFGPSATSPNPAISITNPGTYTLSLVATNSLSSSTYTQVITVGGPCYPLSECLDTLRMIRNVDTLKTYGLASNGSIPGCSSNPGRMTGSNCYKDREYAQFFLPQSYSSTPLPQINSVFVLFDTSGTSGTTPGTQIACKIYGGNATTGPIGLINQRNDSLQRITLAPKVSSVDFVGSPGLAPLSGSKIYLHKFDMNVPVFINSNSGFYVSVTTPTTVSGDSVNIYSNTRYNAALDSSAWLLQFTGNWKRIKTERGHKVQLAIIPQITCSQAVGISKQEKILETGFSVVPNPGSGLFHLVFALKRESDLNIRVYNMMGQEISKARAGNVLNSVVDLDLSGQPEGLYFAEINDGYEKAVKKILLSR